ncbi:MAG: prepilin-type N-terminal cleavage/methylation domain-containing protein [Betaproteobacteria bacterium]|nr:prepilin-type N-terminal cleavage/methylation domain-containing protein [Betaproteobacteria bacterium]
MMKRIAGVTLIELLVVVALIGAILVLAAPAFKDMILMQRLRGVQSELITDLQLARGEAVARRDFVRVRFQSASDSSSTCYTIYTSSNPATRCDCLAGPGSACTAPMIEIKTVLVPRDRQVTLAPVPIAMFGWEPTFAFDWRTGGLYANPTDTDPFPLDAFLIDTYIDSPRKLRTRLNQAGRPLVCKPSGSNMTEASCS